MHTERQPREKVDRAELISSLYGLAYNLESVTQFLEQVKVYFSAQNATFAFFDSVTGFAQYTTSDFPEEVSTQYLAVIEDDSRMRAARSFGPAVLSVLERQLADPVLFRRSQIYQEFFRPFDMKYMMAGGLLSYGGYDSFIVLNRGSSRSDFDTTLTREMWSILPHYEKAMRTKLDILSLRALVDWMPQVTVDEHCNILSANREGEIFLQRNDVFSNSGQRISLKAASKGNLSDKVAEVLYFPSPTGAFSHSSLQIQTAMETLNLVFVNASSVDNRTFELQKRVAILVTSSDVSRRAATEQLAVSLTPSENEVLDLFLLGNDLTQIASRRKRSIQTVRTQMKSIREKCGVKSQTELMRRLRQQPPEGDLET